MLLHSTEFARNYHVALSLLWVAGDESNLKWMQCFSLSNNHLKKSIFTLTFFLSQRSLHFYFSQFFPSWRIQGMPYEIFSTYPCEIPPWNSMEIYGNPWNSTELPWITVINNMQLLHYIDTVHTFLQDPYTDVYLLWNTGSSLYLKFIWNFQVSWNFWSTNFHESVSLFNHCSIFKEKNFSGKFWNT